MQQNLGKSDIELYHDADKAFSPENSLLYMLLPILGFIMGTGLGLGISYIMEILDSKLRTPRQVEINYNVPNIATVPEISGLTKFNATNKLLPYTRSIAERLHLINENLKSLTILSTKQKEGKSTIAYELAQYYKHIGKKTIVARIRLQRKPLF